jgi:hypothetical protein
MTTRGRTRIQVARVAHVFQSEYIVIIETQSRNSQDGSASQRMSSAARGEERTLGWMRKSHLPRMGGKGKPMLAPRMILSDNESL